MRRRITAIVVSLGLFTGIGIVSASSASAFAGRDGGIEDTLGGAVWSGNFTGSGGGLWGMIAY